jgi:hypothetical protein
MDACSQSLELSSPCGTGLGAGAVPCTVLCIVTGTDDSLRERGALVRHGILVWVIVANFYVIFLSGQVALIWYYCDTVMACILHYGVLDSGIGRHSVS